MKSLDSALNAECIFFYLPELVTQINSVCLLQYIMLGSSQKRRNFSRELSFDNKLALYRMPSQPQIPHFNQTISLLKDKSANKFLNITQTDQSGVKRKMPFTPQKYSQQLSSLELKFSNLSSKINVLLKSTEEEKENSGAYQTMESHVVQKGKSGLMKKSICMLGQQSSSQSSSVPYFIQCLRRKSLISKEALMHIQNSIMIFRQYMRPLQHVKARSALPNIPPEIQRRKTIVFDMDQTLIHTNEMMVRGYQLKVPFKSIQGKVTCGYVQVRPYAKQIIKNLSKYFDVFVFTAGNQCYADPILDHIDPDKCIKFRLYRQSCTMLNNQLFVKDLRILGRKLENVVLVDNAPYSYMPQLANGIPILNYLRGTDDDQLMKLQPYLMSLLDVQDVRTVNTATFRLQEYQKYDHYESLVQKLYSKWWNQ